MSPRKRSDRPPHLRVVPEWVREERDSSEPSHRVPAARGPGARRGFGTTWWGAAWVDALDGRAQLDPNRLPRGRGYARSGAVGDLELSVGLVRARVQGSRREPYDVTVRVRVFDDKEWDRVLDVVAAQVGRAAALLDGEVPPEVADDVAAAGSSLLPGPGELQPRCSCPDWADPCKHAAAVCYLVADELDADPFALLRLRGRDREAVLAALRRRRRGGLVIDEPDDRVDGPDEGVPARTAFAADRVRPELPSPPLPPADPGQPAALASDPPPVSGVTTQSLASLVADAAVRAQLLLVGDEPADETMALRLSVEDDVVRRVAVGTAEPVSVALSSAVGLRATDLVRRADAWRIGGAAGVAALVGSWDAPPPLLTPGVEALGPGARRRANRVTSGDVQLRLDQQGRWHPFVRVGTDWQLAGEGSEDAATAAVLAADRRNSS
jgi:uncharacterized Zn finger protein